MSCALCGNEPECWCHDRYVCRACRLESERDDFRKRLDHAVKREEMWEMQRDEARAVARQLYDMDFDSINEKRFPWLGEESAKCASIGTTD